MQGTATALLPLSCYYPTMCLSSIDAEVTGFIAGKSFPDIVSAGQKRSTVEQSVQDAAVLW